MNNCGNKLPWGVTYTPDPIIVHQADNFVATQSDVTPTPIVNNKTTMATTTDPLAALKIQALKLALNDFDVQEILDANNEARLQQMIQAYVNHRQNNNISTPAPASAQAAIQTLSPGMPKWLLWGGIGIGVFALFASMRKRR